MLLQFFLCGQIDIIKSFLKFKTNIIFLNNLKDLIFYFFQHILKSFKLVRLYGLVNLANEKQDYYKTNSI